VLVIRTIPAPDVDCVVVRKGRDVIVYVAESLLSPRVAGSITQALEAARAGERGRGATPEGAEWQ
jgi:hypothetical protein